MNYNFLNNQESNTIMYYENELGLSIVTNLPTIIRYSCTEHKSTRPQEPFENTDQYSLEGTLSEISIYIRLPSIGHSENLISFGGQCRAKNYGQPDFLILNIRHPPFIENKSCCYILPTQLVYPLIWYGPNLIVSVLVQL